MVEFAPATGGLALWVQHADRDMPDAADGPQPPLIATDGLTVFYAPGFARLPPALQTGLVAHEVLHIALRHPQRLRELQALRGDVDARLFNLCADAIVNSALAHLAWLQLPAGALRLEAVLGAALGLKLDAEAALLEWDVERLYAAVDDRRPQSKDGRQQGGRGDGPRAASLRALGADSPPDLLAWSDDGSTSAHTASPDAPEDSAGQSQLWHERLLRAHTSDAAHSMLRTLLADLPRLRTPWQQVLRTRLARGLAQRPVPSWSRPSRSYIANQGRAGAHRRMPWEPGFSASQPAPRLAVVVDVSGSIDEALCQRFATELLAIVRRQQAALVLVVGDDRVSAVRHFQPGKADLQALSRVGFQGGGGTDFAPLLEEAGRHRPDIVVVLTDLDGPAGPAPPWPVIWAVPAAQAHRSPPFGRRLVLD
jgi:hypothetical protein